MSAIPVRSAVVCGALVLCLGLAGCGSKPPPVPETPAQRNLAAIGDAYVRATNRLGRPPKSLPDLVPSLKEHGKPDELLKSPDDGQQYEIVWGVELRMLKATGNDVPIIAYEKVGTDGARNVLRGRAEVLRMTESELKSAKFPEGYKFPF